MSMTYEISKKAVFDAWLKVKKNRGGAGIDGVEVNEFEANLKNNLYKIWVRMSSGSYFPPLIKGVEIPKKSGGVRLLGIPTVGDRVAQNVVVGILESTLEAILRNKKKLKKETKIGRTERLDGHHFCNHLQKIFLVVWLYYPKHNTCCFSTCL